MVEYNFLQNWSFEDDLEGTGWVATPVGKIDELHVEDKVSDSMTGTKHYHFWSSGTVEFNLEQTVTGLKADNYKFTLSTMGGDMGDYEAYIYVKINGEILAQADAGFTVYNEWHTATINNFEVKDGDVVTVGLYVKTAGAGNGAWGKIDDAMLNSIKEN
jgi:arabinogalactan endo-1,4-beta-galactosidase